MVQPWPLVGRDDELRRLRACVNDPLCRGVLVSGTPGVGKTRLLVECLAMAEDDGHPVERVTGTRAASGSPLGAFAALLPPSTDAEFVEQIRECHAALSRRGGTRRLFLAVDDAHQLDGDSATLVHQLATAGEVFVAIAGRMSEHAPDPVHALWRDGVVERVDVEPFGVDTIDDVLRSALGAPVDRAAVSELAARCGGDLHFLRELTETAVASGNLMSTDGVWRFTGPLALSRRLVELVDARLAWLGPHHRAVLELVAFAGMVTADELGTLADLDRAEEVEAAGLLTTTTVPSRIEVRVANPTVRQVVRAQIPALRRSRFARSLADTVGVSTDRDLLRVATWKLDGAVVDAPQALAAAWVAQRQGDFPLGERLARAAHTAGVGFDAALLAAQLVCLQGRAGDGERELASLSERACDDAQRAAVASTRLNNQLFYMGLAPEGMRLAQDKARSIDGPGWQHAAAAARAGDILTTMGPAAAAAAAEPLLAGTTGQPLVLARLVASYSLGRMGAFDASIAIALAGEGAEPELAGAAVGLPFLHVFHRCDALAFRGDLVVAEELGKKRYAQAIAEHEPEQQAIFGWQLAKTVGERGHTGSAVRFGREAAALFHQLDQPQYEVWCLQYLALAHALAGDADSAERALAAQARLGVAVNEVMGVDYLVARGWAAASGGDLRRACELWGQGAERGERSGDLVGATAALHSIARVGRSAEVGDGLRRLSAGVEGRLAPARVAHVRGLGDGDPEALAEVSKTFAAMGADLLAAEAAADAAVTWRLAGEARRAAAAEHRAGSLAARCDGAMTPALQAVAARAVLTTAERATAVLAVRGRSNREIAADLTISVRTAESRLQRAYEKLGVHSRAELATALDVADKR